MSDAIGSADFASFEQKLVDMLRGVFSAGQWLTVGEVAPAAVGLASRICQTADRDPDGFVMALSASPGVGELPPDIAHVSLGLPQGQDLLANIRAAAAAFADLSPEVVAEIDLWDPTGDARALLPFTMVADQIAGRATFGASRPEWKALEDKLAVVAVWRRAGISVAPHAVVDLSDQSAVVEAHRKLAGDNGTVWALDNQAGWHGGADGTFWVPSESDAKALAVERAPTNSKARVMPFLNGVPCSIHGMVFDNRTIAFEPCEMMTFLNLDTGRITYGRSATFWRSPCAEEMRTAAGLVGDELRRTVDFRGVFTLDGVATAEGFRPTEINPRFGAALPIVMPLGIGGVASLYLTHCCVVAGAAPDLNPDKLEAWVRRNMADNPEGRLMMSVKNAPEGVGSGESFKAEIFGGVEPDEPILVVPGESGVGGGDAAATASLAWAHSGAGGISFLHLNPEMVPTGPALAPLALRLIESADAELRLGVPELVPACRTINGDL